MADIPTTCLSDYVTAKGIKISTLARETRISDGVLRRSLTTRERNLRADEFLKICSFLGKDPFEFYQKPELQQTQDRAG
ncbi:MAG: helix-turn-helix domain-containing protein [Acutalibacter muris]|jgi:hypothetical protein|nr:helix-turn-helix domain-containing protein [Acutalibacter muris]